MEKKDYTSYPEGFKKLAADMKFASEDPAVKEATLWSAIEMILNS